MDPQEPLLDQDNKFRTVLLNLLGFPGIGCLNKAAHQNQSTCLTTTTTTTIIGEPIQSYQNQKNSSKYAQYKNTFK